MKKVENLFNYLISKSHVVMFLILTTLCYKTYTKTDCGYIYEVGKYDIILKANNNILFFINTGFLIFAIFVIINLMGGFIGAVLDVENKL